MNIATSGNVVARWEGAWDEAGLRAWAEDLRARCGAKGAVSFGLVFATPGYFARAAELLELLRVHARVSVLAGCSSSALVAAGREFESGEGVVLSLHTLPAGASVCVIPIQPGAPEPEAALRAAGVDAAGIGGWLAFFEPFQTDAEAWLDAWQVLFPKIGIYGGLATGPSGEARAQVYCNGEVIEHGGVVLGFSGVRVLGVVAQGCTPVGETWTITKAEGNVVHRIGNRPAVEVLEETWTNLSQEIRQRSRGNFFAGLVVDEYREDFRRGDFLVRNLLGADPESGALALGAVPRSGQTLQFQLRDAAAADEDIRELLGQLRDRLGRAEIYGGCLCICNGRGQGLFEEADHDAALAHQIIGPAAISGFFCNGEFGPVGPRSFLHGYTSSFVVFAGPARTESDEL